MTNTTIDLLEGFSAGVPSSLGIWAVNRPFTTRFSYELGIERVLIRRVLIRRVVKMRMAGSRARRRGSSDERTD